MTSWVLCSIFMCLFIRINSEFYERKFGDCSECIFPCHCKNAEPCDEDTGECKVCDRLERFDNPQLVYWTGPQCQTGNIGLGRTASQSNNGKDSDASLKYPASKALDGNTNRGLSHPTTIATEHSWWRVDLEEEHVVKDITVHNRNDEHSDRLDGTRVYVSENISDVYTDEELCATLSLDNGTITVSSNCENMIKGRYVTIYQPDIGESLNFFEVQIVGYKYHECQRGKYGPGCAKSCNCDVKCDLITGQCPGECISGKKKPDCQKECE